jgi:hypothetical protein
MSTKGEAAKEWKRERSVGRSSRPVFAVGDLASA